VDGDAMDGIFPCPKFRGRTPRVDWLVVMHGLIDKIDPSTWQRDIGFDTMIYSYRTPRIL
jgi:hypothetical protein